MKSFREICWIIHVVIYVGFPLNSDFFPIFIFFRYSSA